MDELILAVECDVENEVICVPDDVGVLFEFETIFTIGPFDITRTHTKPPAETDTRIFRPTRAAVDKQLKTLVVDGLRSVVPGAITCGRWTYISGDAFDMVAVEVIPGSDDPRRDAEG